MGSNLLTRLVSQMLILLRFLRQFLRYCSEFWLFLHLHNCQQDETQYTSLAILKEPVRLLLGPLA